MYQTTQLRLSSYMQQASFQQPEITLCRYVTKGNSCHTARLLCHTCKVMPQHNNCYCVHAVPYVWMQKHSSCVSIQPSTQAYRVAAVTSSADSIFFHTSSGVLLSSFTPCPVCSAMQAKLRTIGARTAPTRGTDRRTGFRRDAVARVEHSACKLATIVVATNVQYGS